MNADNQVPWWRSDAAKISIVGVLAAGVISFFTPAVQSWFSLGGSATASGSRSEVSSTLTPGVSVASSSSVLTTENAAAGPPSTPTDNAANNNPGAVGPGVGAAGVVPQQTAPTSEYLSDLDPIEGDNRIKVATLGNGGVQTTYAHSLRTQTVLTDYTFKYNITGGFQYFHAVIGIDTTAPSGSVVEFEVYLDGSSVGDYTLGTNTTQDIKIPVTGHGQIKLYTTLVHNAGESVAAVWGNAEYVNS